MTTQANTEPVRVRCPLCRSRCRWSRRGWIWCRRRGCAWAQQDRRRTGLLWRLRVAVGR